MPRLRHLLTLTLGAALLHLPWCRPKSCPGDQEDRSQGRKNRRPVRRPDGLRGYAAQYQNRGMALYLTPDGKHVLLGNLYDADGNDLSSAPLQKLVYAPMAKEVWGKMEASNWIADGNKDARASFTCSAIRTAPTATCSGTGSAMGQGRQSAIAPHHGRQSAKTARANPPHCWPPRTRSKALEDHETAGKGSSLKALKDVHRRFRPNSRRT